MIATKGRISNEMKLLRFRQRSKKGFRSQVVLTLPAGIAKADQRISTISSQFGIDANKFCQDFNNRTREFIHSLPIPLIVTVTWEKSYSFIYRPLPMLYVIRLLCYNDVLLHSVRSISVLSIYTILQIYSENDLLFSSLSGTLRSMNVSIILFDFVQYIALLKTNYVGVEE